MTITVGASSASIPPTDRSTGIDWADSAVDQTVAGSGTATQSWGFEFESPGSPPPDIQCTWIVPEDYLDTGSVPQVTLMGWSISDSPCTFDGGGTRYALWNVHSRAYASGEVANAAWSSAGSGSWSFACENNACGSGIHCRLSDKLKTITLDAASATSDWQPGDLVFLRIRRSSTSDNLAGTVHLARVRLRWPSQN